MHQRQPDQQHRQRQDDKLRQHHPFDNFGREDRAFVHGFCDLNQCWPAAGDVCAHPHGGDPQVDPFVVQLPHPDFALGYPVVVGRRRQVFFAAEVLTLAAKDLVVDGVRIVCPEELAGRQREHKLHPVFADRNQLGQGSGVVLEGAVKRLAGNALRYEPGQYQTHGPQQQQRGQHPVEDFPEQAALLPLEYFHPGIFSKQ